MVLSFKLILFSPPDWSGRRFSFLGLLVVVTMYLDSQRWSLAAIVLLLTLVCLQQSVGRPRFAAGIGVALNAMVLLVVYYEPVRFRSLRQTQAFCCSSSLAHARPFILLGVFIKFFVAQAWAVRTTRYLVRYKHVKSAVAGHGFTLGGMTVKAQVPGTEHWDSSARLDYIFASLGRQRALPIKEALVLRKQTFFDHQPVTACLQFPSPILLPTPPHHHPWCSVP